MCKRSYDAVQLGGFSLPAKLEREIMSSGGCELRSECPICAHARVTQMDAELTLLEPDPEKSDPKNHENPERMS